LTDCASEKTLICYSSDKNLIYSVMTSVFIMQLLLVAIMRTACRHCYFLSGTHRPV